MSGGVRWRPHKAFEADELQVKGILKGSGGVAPGLVAKKEELEKQIRRDSLTHGLAARPAPEELQEPVAGGPGYVVVTVLRARGLRKVRIAFPPRGEKKEKESPIMNLLPLIHDSLFPFLFSAHAPTHPHTQRNALS